MLQHEPNCDRGQARKQSKHARNTRNHSQTPAENLHEERNSSGQSVACEENQGKKKKLTLEELKKLSPPGYKEFEAAVGSKDLDEQTALQLWEDIFKPLDIFELLNIV